ncbi:hypothetical protein N7474_005139 [Penicillium riverlandense]|uniref:uncharacterized protein n=1 Tax=Penicillium riverlandense TaxID=1903569 RepID=UPI002549AA47|nr:uncharacterized protein N7474_005139 [Penicillium riverlandense]KAJ5819548.1 hypothetical protein N7474_005139 [Penicillium riverlandense]
MLTYVLISLRHTWLDPDENIELRHQITDLLGEITSSILPNLEEKGSMSLVAFHEKLDPDSHYRFVDFMRQLLLAREANLRIQRAKRRWYGGITSRAIYDMVAADLFARHMEPKDGPEQGYTPSPGVVKQQLDGVIKFADEMRWPYADEIRQAAIKLQNMVLDEMDIDLRVADWICGWVLPGGTFSMTLVAVLYNLSSTLRGHLPIGAIRLNSGCFGIIFPHASYWNVRSVLGKVLAPLALDSESGHSQVRCLGGWVGPCPSVSLPDCAFGRLVMLSGHAPPSVDSQDKETTKHKNVQGDGVAWTLPTPPELSPYTAVLQAVRLSKAPPSPERIARDAESFSARLDFCLTRSRTYVTFTLYTNSVFIAAPPCQGTHRVDPHASEKYTFAVRGIEELAQIARKGGSSAKVAILVINATGGPASEVFARAWCCHTGTNAVIWKREGGMCCFKCALLVASTDGLAMGVLIAT